MPEGPTDTLRWRIPTGADPRMLRLGIAQIGMGAIVCALVLYFAAPREWLVPALVGIIPLAIFLAYRRWKAFDEAFEGPDNVWLDAAGLHWLDQQGQERTLDRREVVGFHVGRDAETMRPVPALVLHLAGGLESQPVELHRPATPDRLRQLLTSTWQIPERTSPAAEAGPGYDLAIDVYSECHDEYQVWHWEGTREALIELFAAIGQAAAELPLAPHGARPARRVILARRREPSRIAIEHDRQPHFGPQAIAGPAELLVELSRQGLADLDKLASAVGEEATFDVSLGERGRWTFHLHVV